MFLIINVVVFSVGLSLGLLLGWQLGSNSARRRIKEKGILEFAEQGQACLVGHGGATYAGTFHDNGIAICLPTFVRNALTDWTALQISVGAVSGAVEGKLDPNNIHKILVR